MSTILSKNKIIHFSGICGTGMASLAVTPSGAITLTAGAASTWSTSAGALTITSDEAASWTTTGGKLTIKSGDSGEDIGLATVYRVLTQFAAAGLVVRHRFEGDHSVFE